MLLIWLSAVALAAPQHASDAFGSRAGAEFLDAFPVQRWDPTMSHASHGPLHIASYLLDGNTLTDPVTGMFSVYFDYVLAAEVPRTALLGPRGPRPIPRTLRAFVPSW